MMKAGRYTAALMLVGVGAALLMDLATDSNWTAVIIDWWPVVLIALGVEYMIVTLVNRNNGKKIGIAFGSLFFAVVISIAAIAATNAATLKFLRDWGIQLGNITIGNVSFADENGRRFEMDPVRTSVDGEEETIYLRNPNGNVTIRTGDVKEIELKGTVYVPQSVENAEEIVRQSEIRIDHKGDRLEIIVEGKEYRSLGIKQKPRINLAVTVPRDLDQNWHIGVTNGNVDAAGITVRDRLIAETVNGSVELADIVGSVTGDTANGEIILRNIRGDASADTANGQITINGVVGDAFAETAQGRVDMRDIDGDVFVDTMNGNVSLERIGGNVKAETANGSINLTGAGGAVDASTTNGNISVRTERLAGDYDLDSVNGAISLYLPEDASFEVDGKTMRGGIETDFPLDVDRNEIKGSVNGGKYEVEIETHGGIVINGI